MCRNLKLQSVIHRAPNNEILSFVSEKTPNNAVMSQNSIVLSVKEHKQALKLGSIQSWDVVEFWIQLTFLFFFNLRKLGFCISFGIKVCKMSRNSAWSALYRSVHTRTLSAFYYLHILESPKWQCFMPNKCVVLF